MHHATCGNIKMVGREDVPGLDVNNYSGAPTARHCPGDCFLQGRNAGCACQGWKCGEAHEHRCEASADHFRAGHALIVTARRNRVSTVHLDYK
jgi:hypothetical protein